MGKRGSSMLKTTWIMDDEVDAFMKQRVEDVRNSNEDNEQTVFDLLQIVSGDDDLPQRDDIGERRRKHELRVLAGTGIKFDDDDDAILEAGDSEDDLYEQAKKNRAAKLAAKAVVRSRSSVPSLPESTVDGKRHITYQMEKNRGLTRVRNKDKMNPRKNYKRKHEKQMKNRKGQVREIKKPIGPYGGETSGINPRISRSVRF